MCLVVQFRLTVLVWSLASYHCVYNLLTAYLAECRSVVVGTADCQPESALKSCLVTSSSNLKQRQFEAIAVLPFILAGSAAGFKIKAKTT